MIRITLWITMALIGSLLSKNAFAWEPVTRSPQKSVVTTTKSSRSGAALYDQLYPLAWSSIVSVEATDAANAGYTCIAADDFIVPAGENWTVNYVNAAGTYSTYTGATISGINVIFYEDNNGVPGNVISEMPDVNFYVQTIDPASAIFLYDITLTTPVELSAGHYWVSVQAVTDFSVTGTWGWYTHDGLVIENQYHWKNPANGFGLGATDWTPAASISWGSQNLAFALYGPGMENDLSGISIIEPVNTPNLTSTETLVVNFKNEGPTPMTGFQVGYSINGGPAFTENVGSFTLDPNQTAAYSFATKADLSVPGPYTITAFANHSSDPDHSNDSVSVDIYNYGTVYQMVATGTQTITACNATFTDAGGLNGNFGKNDNAITTIYPASPGDRVRLTFLEFNASYGGFKVYNGTDVNAPLMGDWQGTQSPGVITALNNAGALTIEFKGPGWEETSGWVAFISCVTPLNNEFTISNMTADLTTVFEGNTVTLKALVQNIGKNAYNKAVNFKVNGTSIGTVSTGLLNAFDTVTVTKQWLANTPGDFIVSAELPADDDNSNNYVSIERSVLAYNVFYEDFEGAEFPPTNWYHGGKWSRNTNPASGAYCATAFIARGQQDTLVSCRVDIGNNPVLNFYARTTMWWVGNLDLWFYSETTHTWNFIKNIGPLPGMVYSNFSADLSEYTGHTGRIGFLSNITDAFSSSGQVSIDLITGQNITTHFEDYDLMAKSIDGLNYYTVGQQSDFQFTIKNIGLQTVEADSYRIALMLDNGNGLELYSVSGEEIEPSGEHTFNLSYTFNDISEYAVYGKIIFDNDAYQVNNTGEKFYLTGIANDSEVVEVGEVEFVSEAPIIFYYNHSLTESLYPSEDIGEAGVIFGINYKFNFHNDELDVPVKVWMGTTTKETLDEWVPAGQMTLVFEGDVDFLMDKRTAYLPFQTPFNYSDPTLNLVIMVQKDTDYTSNDQYFYNYSGSGINTLTQGSNDSPIDPYSPTSGGQSNTRPSLDLIFNNNTGSASGNVHDATQAPLADVKVLIEPLNITVYTDGTGNYNIPFVPAGNFNTSANKYGYQPNIQTLNITAGNNTSLDFEMLVLGNAVISGKIVGNDNPGTGIANATISLDGYNTYSTTTDSEGNFTLAGVFIATDYNFTIEAAGYNNYEVVLDVVEDADLGTITLTEAMSLPRVVTAVNNTTNVSLSWFEPGTTYGDVLSFDDGKNEEGYAGEPTETVWLGNYFPIEEPVTVTSFDLYWARYGNSIPKPHRLDIYNDQRQLIYRSEEFTSVDNGWINVPIIPMTLSGDYFVMVSWENTLLQSNYLGIDTASSNTPDYAHYYYQGGEFYKLSSLTGFSGSFLIHANVLKGDQVKGIANTSERSISGYDIKFGLFDDLSNAANWPLINSSLVAASPYIDEAWPPAVAGKYIYGVKTHFTTGESEFSFSNTVVYDPTSTNNIITGGIRLYPNPTSEKLTIETTAGSELMIFNMDGQLLHSEIMTGNSHTLDVTRFVKGTLLVVLKTTEGIAQEKVVIR